MAASDSASLRDLEAERHITDEQVKRLDQAVAAAEKTALNANTATEALAGKHNELIRKGEEREATFATREEAERLRDELGSLRTAQARITGASVIGSVILAVLINLILRLSGLGGH
jgi:hypothetical protein